METRACSRCKELYAGDGRSHCYDCRRAANRAQLAKNRARHALAPPDPRIDKVCSQCKQTKKGAEFYVNRNKKDGFNDQCRECHRRLQALSRQSNRDRHARRAADPAACKRCPCCAREKPETEFGVLRSRPDGLYPYCKECQRDRKLKYDYGLTAAQKEAMAAAQKGRCTLCLWETELVVDHCHRTGRVRGLLCGECNKGLGFLRDDPEVARRAAAYLDVWK